MSVPFDSLDYTIGAENIGIKREHAEYQARALAKLFNEQLVTKSFLIHELMNLENRLVIKLGSLMIAGMGLLGFILSH
jgi:hypothetical protein